MYKKETNFKEVIKLVNLDDAYAKMLYELIGVFERNFKSVYFRKSVITMLHVIILIFIAYDMSMK